MKIERYKEFDRIFPKIRLSYSLYQKWIKNDWVGVFEYLTRNERRGTKAMETGKEGHRFLELHPPVAIRNIVGEGIGEMEKRIEIETPEYILVGVIDWLINDYVVDYKFGGRDGYEMQLQNYFKLSGKKKGLIVQCEPVRVNDVIVGATVKHTAEYRRDNQKIAYWDLVLDEMANTIKYQITNGEFEKWLNYYTY